jgi:hypothetical protein
MILRYRRYLLSRVTNLGGFVVDNEAVEQKELPDFSVFIKG